MPARTSETPAEEQGSAIAGARAAVQTVPALPGSRIAEAPFYVRVAKGADLGLISVIGAKPLTIGTSPNADLCVSDRRVSRLHCDLFTRGDQCLVRDLGSTNGTYLDGVMVVEAVLSTGAIVRIGKTDLLIERHDGVTAAHEPAHFGEMVGRSNVSLQMFASPRRVANSSLTCLLLGETGTGKELAARALHGHSDRAHKPFLVVDCAAAGPQFIEDKLFGHERGAFTGATGARPGVFEQAHGGSVFLDEIGELPIELQPKLLGVLERREATRIGSHTPIKLDVRVIAATHRNLSQMVQRSTFRQDLLYRLSEFTLRLPALRERAEDIDLIAESLLQREGLAACRVTEDAIEYLRGLDWHGNVRELRNLLRRAALLGDGAAVDRELLQQLDEVTAVFHMPPEVLGALASEPLPEGPHQGTSDGVDFSLPLEQATEACRKAYVLELRRRFGDDLIRAATHAGIHPKSVSRLFRLYRVY